MTKQTQPQQVFTKEYIKENKVRAVWSYDLSQNPNGPISVELFYPSDYKSDVEIEETLPITKRTFWNPNTQSFVAYARAKQLGLI